MTDRSAPIALGVVRAVCRVAELHPDDGSDGVTAIDKRVVDGPVPVGPDGVRGDVQVSRKHHGGADKAVYALDVVESEHWAAELGRPVPPGLFGENLVLDVRVDDAELGERWRIGQRLEVELTGPRTPCGTFARWLGQEGWVQRYTRRGRPGAYLRVVTPGPVQAGDPVVLLHRPGHGVAVGRWFVARDPADAIAVLQADAAGRCDLADYLRRPLELAAGRTSPPQGGR